MEVPPASTTGSTAADSSTPARFRIMCSYGGHLIPRPHDKTLSYIGGETRIVLVDRHVSLADIHARLTKTLNQNYPFVLKYQLPNEDLDSLISVTTDEDLQNMVEEHDRVSNRHGRLRLFLFPKTVQSFDLGLVCGNSSNKGSSEEWFMGVLNGKVKSLSSVFSDSSNCLIGLELDDNDENKSVHRVSSKGGVFEGQLVENDRKLVSDNPIVNQDVRSVPETPKHQTNSSSFGSTTSSKSGKVGTNLGVEEQFQHMGIVGGNVHGNNNVVDQKQQNLKEDVVGVNGSECVNRFVVSDDERSDHGEGCRKVQEVLQQVQVVQQVHPRQVNGGVLELASPDSVSSEGSITNPLSWQRHTIHQEQPTFVQNNRIITNQPDSKITDQSNTKIQIQPQIQESGYVFPSQYDKHHHHPQLHHPQQFVHSGAQYIPGGPVPMASYYPIYPPQHQNHPNQPPVLDQHYPVYFIQDRPTQAYNLPAQQQNFSELASNALFNQSQKPPHLAYNQALNAPSSNSENVSGGYRTMSSSAPQLVQVPSSQHQPNYVNYAQIHHPSQSVAQSSATNKAAYTYEVADPAHAQMYYTTQPLPPHMVAQYPTTMSSSPMPVQPDASSQALTENRKQQVRTVQP